MNITVFDTVKKEFSVTERGIASVSKKGLGRLCGVSDRSWFHKTRYYLFNKKLDEYIVKKLNLGAIQNKQQLLETLTNKGLIGSSKNGYSITDVLADIVIKFYAYKAGSDCTEIAEQVQDVLGSIGFRSFVHDLTGWNKPKRDYGNLLLSAPRVWTKVFGDEYYDQLSRLTGLDWDKKTHQKPCIFAQLTNDLVYSHLPSEVYNKIKQTQKEHGGYIHKMHQFLNEDGLTALITHLDKTLYILSAVASIESAKHLVTQSVTGIYQQTLFGE